MSSVHDLLNVSSQNILDMSGMSGMSGMSSMRIYDSNKVKHSENLSFLQLSHCSHFNEEDYDIEQEEFGLDQTVENKMKGIAKYTFNCNFEPAETEFNQMI